MDLKCDKCDKSAIFLTIIELSLRTGYSHACRTNLSRIHEKLVKLSCPEVNVNADVAEFQLQ